MPEAAIQAGTVDKILPIDEIAPAVLDFVGAIA
jgi:chemotaxis response regulator CheB